MRISGSLLLKEQYKAPWAVSVPSSDTLNTLLQTRSDVRIAAFHLVERGHIRIKVNANGHDSAITEDILVEAGEMVVCFSGADHLLYQDDANHDHASHAHANHAVPFQSIMAGNNNPFAPTDEQLGGCTSLVCGVFLLHDTLLNPLLAALPPVMKFSVTHPHEQPRLYGIVNLLVQEFQTRTIGNPFAIQRYLEVLCAEAIRAHVDSLPANSRGWLAALKDPVIGRAIEAIHAQPGHHWSVKDLADSVTISPSRFAARFSDALGESPMIYVTRWRMVVASRMLQSQQQSIDQIANDVGYESLAAFSRAFKRHVGLPPATWRATHSNP